MRASHDNRWLSRSRSWLISVLLYGLVLIACQWPLFQHAQTHLPLGPTDSCVVPLFNLWTFWWNSDRATQGFQGYWDAPIFYPVADTFAFSEPQPTSLIVAPVIWLTGSRILAYNVYFWLSWLLNAVFAERLFRDRGTPVGLARLGGVMMILLPMLQWNRDVIQLIPVWGILWLWQVFGKLSRETTLARGVELGVAAGVTCLSCMHYGLFVAILSLGTVWFHIRRWRSWRTWRDWTLGAVVAALIAGPIIGYVHSVLSRQAFDRPDAIVRSLSMLPGDYTAAWGWSLFPWGTMAARPDWQMSPGWIKCLVAGFGVGIGLWHRRSRRWVGFLAVTAAFSWTLSLGKNLSIGHWSIWDSLCRIVPGLAQVRSPYRFANLLQMAIVLLAVEAVRVLLLWDRARRISLCIWEPASPLEHLRRNVIQMIAGALTVLMCLEVLPHKLRLWDSSEIKLGSTWIEYVKQHTPPGKAILCLPFARGSKLAEFDLTAKWMYVGTWHGVPLVNGYSGFFPPEESELRGEFQDDPPTVERLLQLSRDGVEFVVESSLFHVHELPPSHDQLKIERVFHDPVGVNVYRLIPE